MSDHGTQYRTESIGEEAVVGDVVRRAFAHQVGVDTLLADLRRSDAWLDLSFVAERDGVVVGHVAITRSLLDAPARLVDVLVLSPLSVAPEVQRQGIGRGLVAYAWERLQERPEPLLFLEGDPRYYGRLGFVAGGTLGLRRPSLRIPEAAFQARALPAYRPDMTGTLVYHRIWWDHDVVGLRPDR